MGSAGGGQTTGGSTAFFGTGHSLRAGGGGARMDASEDADLAAAIAVSLSEGVGSGPEMKAAGVAAPDAFGVVGDDSMDADLPAASAASIAEAQPASQMGQSEAAAPASGGNPDAEELRRR